MKQHLIRLGAFLFLSLATTASRRTSAAEGLPPAPVATDRMKAIYDEVKTPFKYGIVLRGETTNQMVDCPNVFRHGAHWYMMYVAITDGVGYETFLARSLDLLQWTKLGKIMSFTKTGWDAWQADGGIALVNHQWGGDLTLGTHDGKYWLSYIGGALKGYETDPLSIGMAWTRTPAWPREWKRIAQNPVLGPTDAARPRIRTKDTLQKQHHPG